MPIPIVLMFFLHFYNFRRDYQRSILLEPECLVGRVNLAYNMQISGSYKIAWNLFTACLKLNPSESLTPVELEDLRVGLQM